MECSAIAADADMIVEAARGRLTTEQQMNSAVDRIAMIEEQVTTLAEKMESIIERLKQEADKRQSIERRMGLALFPASGGAKQ